MMFSGLKKAKRCQPPFFALRGKSIVPVIWSKRGHRNTGVNVLTPDVVLDSLQ